MKAIIPVAGFGTRMRPHTFSTPKVLLNVAGKPMLDHIIDSLKEAGVDGVTLIVGYLGDVIEKHVRARYPDMDNHFVEQKEMLGLGHAISLGKALHHRDKQLLIILGDTILKADFPALLGTKDTAIGVREVDDPRRFGVVELKSDGSISRMLEKPEHPPTKKAIVGVYKIGDPALLFAGLDHIMQNDIRTKNEYQLTDALAWMLEKGHRMVPFDIEKWLDCGKPETLFETNRVLLDEKSDDPELLKKRFPLSVIHPPVSIAEGCVIEDSVVGPYAVLGKNCKVTHATIHNSIIGDGAEIRSIMIKESLIGNEAVVSSHSHRLNIGNNSTIEMG